MLARSRYGFTLTFHNPTEHYPSGFWTPYCKHHKKNATTGCTKLIRVTGDGPDDEAFAVRLAKSWCTGCISVHRDRQWAHLVYMPLSQEVLDDASLDAAAADLPAPCAPLLTDAQRHRREQAERSRTSAPPGSAPPGAAPPSKRRRRASSDATSAPPQASGPRGGRRGGRRGTAVGRGEGRGTVAATVGKTATRGASDQGECATVRPICQEQPQQSSPQPGVSRNI